jgi:hypothetical protein
MEGKGEGCTSPIGAALLCRKVRNQQKRSVVLPAEYRKALAPAVAMPPAAEASAKRVRALQKKLREIGRLEARVADGAVLQESEREKLGRKGEVEAQMASLLALREQSA